MSKSTDLATLIQGFRLYCLAEGRRPSTIRWYMGKLHIFSKWLEDNHCPLDAELLRIQHLRSFMAYPREVKADTNNPYKPSSSASLSSRTIQGYARTLRAFFSWCVREGYLAESPARLLRVPKAAKRIVPTLTPDQIRAIFAAVDGTTPPGFRDLCVMMTLLDTGVRLSELVNLQLPNLHLEEAYFNFMGKGWKERMVPIGAKVQKALWKYLQVYRPQPIHPGVRNVFLTIHGRPVSPHTIYERIVRQEGRFGRGEILSAHFSPYFRQELPLERRGYVLAPENPWSHLSGCGENVCQLDRRGCSGATQEVQPCGPDGHSPFLKPRLLQALGPWD